MMNETNSNEALTATIEEISAFGKPIEVELRQINKRRRDMGLEEYKMKKAKVLFEEYQMREVERKSRLEEKMSLRDRLIAENMSSIISGIDVCWKNLEVTKLRKNHFMDLSHIRKMMNKEDFAQEVFCGLLSRTENREDSKALGMRVLNAESIMERLYFQTWKAVEQKMGEDFVSPKGIDEKAKFDSFMKFRVWSFAAHKACDMLRSSRAFCVESDLYNARKQFCLQTADNWSLEVEQTLFGNNDEEHVSEEVERTQSRVCETVATLSESNEDEEVLNARFDWDMSKSTAKQIADGFIDFLCNIGVTKKELNDSDKAKWEIFIEEGGLNRFLNTLDVKPLKGFTDIDGNPIRNMAELYRILFQGYTSYRKAKQNYINAANKYGVTIPQIEAVSDDDLFEDDYAHQKLSNTYKLVRIHGQPITYNWAAKFKSKIMQALKRFVKEEEIRHNQEVYGRILFANMVKTNRPRKK